jgi:type II restriction enzyme
MSSWTSNKGEWSEAYVLLKLLVDPALVASDSQLNPVDGRYYIVKQIIWRSKNEERILTPKANAYSSESDTSKSVTLDEIRDALPKILFDISQGERAFPMPIVQDIYERMGLPSFKMSSAKKIDISLVIPSMGGVQDRELGFSIKSQLGSNSTLLNASSTTNIRYMVQGKDAREALGSEGLGHYRANLDAISANAGSLIFDGFESDTFSANLRNFSSDFPEFYAEMVRTYVTGESSTRNLAELTTVSSTSSSEVNQRRYQVKSFLRAVALGLVPGSQWSGKLAGYGGYIVVKRTGELVCLHLDNDDEFKDYLFENTAFDIPKNDLFQSPKVIEDELQIFLNAQIRFTS